MKLILALIGLLISLPVKAFGWVENIRTSALMNGVDPSLVLAFAEVESNFNPKALRFEPKFKTYSVGLFQIFYPTAKTMGFRGTVQNLMDPKKNTEIAIKHIKACAERFSTYSNIACCYNAGASVKISVCKNNKKIKTYVQKVLESQKKWQTKAR
jgi:soluble lytic murein transglycosylase-like protein